MLIYVNQAHVGPDPIDVMTFVELLNEQLKRRGMDVQARAENYRYGSWPEWLDGDPDFDAAWDAALTELTASEQIEEAAVACATETAAACDHSMLRNAGELLPQVADFECVEDEVGAELSEEQATQFERAFTATLERLIEVPTQRCAYCGADVPTDEGVPAKDDDEAWTELAQDHVDGCDWIVTRAHSVNMYR